MTQSPEIKAIHLLEQFFNCNQHLNYKDGKFYTFSVYIEFEKKFDNRDDLHAKSRTLITINNFGESPKLKYHRKDSEEWLRELAQQRIDSRNKSAILAPTKIVSNPLLAALIKEKIRARKLDTEKLQDINGVYI